MMPPQKDIDLPLLKALAAMGGKGAARDVYKAVEEFFPQLTDADRSETLPSGGSRWTNRIQWVRQALVDRGELTGAGRGIWAITDKGRRRLELELKPPPDTRVSSGPVESLPSEALISSDSGASAEFPVNLEELAEDYAAAFERKVLQELKDREPSEFEAFATKLLTAYGFRKVKVTNERTAPDGGIDGDGELKVGLVNMRAAFQCKKWRGSVGRPEIDKFRGAIQGKFEHGYFFTTSTFSSEARQASIRDGAVPIFLFDGHEIIQIMIDKGLGIGRRPIEIYEDRVDSLFDKED
jgi:restriction system protein